MPRHKLRLRCVNCGVHMLSGVACAALAPRARSLLLQWIPPHELEGSSVCRECHCLLDTLEPGGERPKGHARLCRVCGFSLVGRQCRAFDQSRDDPHVARVLDLIAANTLDRYQHLKWVCMACYMRSERTVARSAALASMSSTEQIAEETEEPPNEHPKESETQTEKQTAENSRPTLSVCGQTESQSERRAREQTERVTLSLYRRVRVQTDRAGCAVAGCCEAGAPRAPLPARRRLLRARRLYLPGAARLCRAHARPDADLAPLLRQKTSKVFTGEQIADMLFLMKPFPPPLDADNVEAMDECLRRIWLGVTLEGFLAKKRDNPSMSERALAIRLCAETSGECAEVLASLFQLPRDTVDAALRAPARDNDVTEAQTTTTEVSNESCPKDLFEGKAPTPQAMDVDCRYNVGSTNVGMN